MSDDEIVGNEYDSVSLGLANPHIVPSGTVLPGRRRYLFFYLHRHLNFRLAESQALAEIAYGTTKKMQ